MVQTMVVQWCSLTTVLMVQSMVLLPIPHGAGRPVARSDNPRLGLSHFHTQTRQGIRKKAHLLYFIREYKYKHKLVVNYQKFN